MNGHELAIGVTGGIAAYKTAALVSQLVQSGARVSVVMTDVSLRFMGTSTFAALTGRAVLTDVFDTTHYPLGTHVELAAKAELLCIAPATANFLAKAAAGIADDLLSTLYLSYAGPVLAAPAMNCDMWEKLVVQRNVKQLKQDGVQLIAPEEGWLSCRQRGIGRMAAPDTIYAAIARVLAEQEGAA